MVQKCVFMYVSDIRTTKKIIFINLSLGILISECLCMRNESPKKYFDFRALLPTTEKSKQDEWPEDAEGFQNMFAFELTQLKAIP